MVTIARISQAGTKYRLPSPASNMSISRYKYRMFLWLVSVQLFLLLRIFLPDFYETFAGCPYGWFLCNDFYKTFSRMPIWLGSLQRVLLSRTVLATSPHLWADCCQVKFKKVIYISQNQTRYMIYHIQHLGNIVTSKLCAGAWKRGEEPSFRRHTHRPSLHLLVPFNFWIYWCPSHSKFIGALLQILNSLVTFNFCIYWCPSDFAFIGALQFF